MGHRRPAYAPALRELSGPIACRLALTGGRTVRPPHLPRPLLRLRRTSRLGMQRAGFHVLAAIDVIRLPSPRSVQSANRPSRPPAVAHALERDLTRFQPETSTSLARTEPGGRHRRRPALPGLQQGAPRGWQRTNGPAWSMIRAAILYPSSSSAYLVYFQPRVFVMENVPEHAQRRRGGLLHRRPEGGARARATASIAPSECLGTGRPAETPPPSSSLASATTCPAVSQPPKSRARDLMKAAEPPPLSRSAPSPDGIAEREHTMSGVSGWLAATTPKGRALFPTLPGMPSGKSPPSNWACLASRNSSPAARWPRLASRGGFRVALPRTLPGTRRLN